MKTKLLYATIFAFLLVAAISCAADERFPSQDNSAIKLSSVHATMLAGGGYGIEVLSDGNYALINSDPDIASGWWTNDGTRIWIKGENVGNTSIWVIDQADRSKDVEIKVSCCYFSGWFTAVASAEGCDCEISVIAVDKSVEEAITSELRSGIIQRLGTFYRFEGSTKSVTIDFTESTFRNGIYEGTYEWTKNSLTIYYDGITEVYGFQEETDQTVVIGNDFTKEYQNLYPDAGIKEVRIISLLHNSIKIGGLN